MENFHPLSTSSPPNKVAQSIGEIESINTVEIPWDIVNTSPIPLSTAPQEFGNVITSVMAPPITFASHFPEGNAEAIQPRDVSSIDKVYVPVDFYLQDACSYPITSSVVNRNEITILMENHTSSIANWSKNFIEIDDSIYQLDRSTKEPKEEIINCRIAFVEEREVYDLDECKSFYVIHVKTSLSESNILILKDHLDSLYTHLKKTFSEISYNAECGKAKELFKQYVAERYAKDKNSIKTAKTNKYPGWGKRFEPQKYHCGQMDDGSPILSLPAVDKENKYELYSYGINLLKLAPLDIILPLFIHVHSGFARKLFEEASLPIQYVPTLIAPTGSRKSSLAKTLFMLFNHDSYASFNDTDRATELVASIYKDQTVIFDDCKLSNDKALLAKFEKFIRPLSESQGRAKSSEGGSRIERNQQMHTAIITAETYPSELQQSSKLRLLPIFMSQNDVDNEVLSCLQKNRTTAQQQAMPSKIDKYIRLFIHYLEEHYNSIVNMIQNAEPIYTISRHARLNAMYQVQVLLGRIILEFGSWCNYYTPEEVESIYHVWTNSIKNLIEENHRLCSDATPTTIFLRTIANGEGFNEVTFAPDKATYWSNPEAYIGLINKDDLIIIPSPAFTYVEKACARLGRRMEYTMDSIASRLRDEGISRGYGGSDRKKNRPYTKLSKGSKKIDVITIPLSKYNEIIMEEN